MALNHKPDLQRKTSGSALITALFIVALVAIASTAMSIRLQQDIQRTRSSFTADNRYLASQAVLFWAMGALRVPFETQTTHAWTFPKAHQRDYPNVFTTGRLVDLQSRFNLNQLMQDKTGKPEAARSAQLLFYRLLKNVLETNSPDTESLPFGSILHATINWVNDIQPGQENNALTQYYLSQDPPYLPSYQAMQSISEFRLVRGVNATIYNALLPYLTALPPPTAINLNTASIPVLMALGDGLASSDVETILQARGENGLQSLMPVQEILQKAHIASDQVCLESSYFLCISNTTTGDITLTRYTILHRTRIDNAEYKVTVVHDSLNSL